MKSKISFYLNNSDQIQNLLIAQQKNFESEDFNYKTIKKRAKTNLDESKNSGILPALNQQN